MEYNFLAQICVLQAGVFCLYLHTCNLVASAHSLYILEEQGYGKGYYF